MNEEREKFIAKKYLDGMRIPEILFYYKVGTRKLKEILDKYKIKRRRTPWHD